MGLMREPWLEATMVILRLAFGLMLILLGSSCATQPPQPPHPYMTNDFMIMLDQRSRGCETEGETTKCTIKFSIPGGTTDFSNFFRRNYKDPGNILVYLDHDTAVYNQQNVRHQAIDLNGSATKPSCFLWVCDRAPYVIAQEDNNRKLPTLRGHDTRLLELNFKHPSDFRPEFLDVTVFWSNVILLDHSYRTFDGEYLSYSSLGEIREERTFKFEIGTPFGWRPEIADPNNLKGVFNRLSSEGR
jgi:hypothetical protein